MAAERKACSTIHNRFATEHDLERLGSVLGAAQRGRRTSSPARSCRDQSEALAADRLKAAAETRIAHERFVTLACLRQSSAAIEACQRSCANLSERALNGLALTQGRALSAVGTVLASPAWPRSLSRHDFLVDSSVGFASQFHIHDPSLLAYGRVVETGRDFAARDLSQAESRETCWRRPRLSREALHSRET